MSARRRHRRIVRALVATSAAGWAVLALADISPVLPRLCSASGWSLPAHAGAAARLNPPGPLVLSYLAMLAAMMAPLLALPLREVSDRAAASARLRAMGTFVLGYALVWMLAAPVFGLAITWLETAPAPDADWGVLLPAALALGWHMTPARQFALNRCHRRLTGFFGPRGGFAHLLGQAAGHGTACLAACAPLMLLAMTQPRWHLPAMMLAAAFLLAERRMPPERVGWGPRNITRTASRLGYFLRHSLASARRRPVHG